MYTYALYACYTCMYVFIHNTYILSSDGKTCQESAQHAAKSVLSCLEACDMGVDDLVSLRVWYQANVAQVFSRVLFVLSILCMLLCKYICIYIMVGTTKLLHRCVTFVLCVSFFVCFGVCSCEGEHVRIHTYQSWAKQAIDGLMYYVLQVGCFYTGLCDEKLVHVATA